MDEFMYDLDSSLIAVILFVSMAAAIEIGYRVGLRGANGTNESAKAHVNAIQASLLGVLALLLGFTFSLALQRFDNRSEAVVDEANAIGTAWLRTSLLAGPARAEAAALVAEYLDLRLQANAVDLAHDATRTSLLERANATLTELWSHAAQTAIDSPSPATTGLYVQAVNEMIDSFGRRDAELARHVPELVLLLLYSTFLMTGVIVGYAAGVGNHRASFVTYVMIGLIVLLVFIIIDLDRPRRGLIEVDQQSMTALQDLVEAPAPGAAGQPRAAALP